MSIEPKLFNEWAILIGTISGLLAGAWVIVRRLRKYFTAINEGITYREKMREHFGEHPAQALRILVDELQGSHDIIAAKADILLRKSRIGIYICDSKSGRCLWVSDFLGELFGLSPATMLGLGWSSQIEGRKQAVESWEWCVENRTNYSDEYIVRNARTGEALRCKTEAFFIDGSEPRYVGYVEMIG